MVLRETGLGLGAIMVSVVLLDRYHEPYIRWSALVIGLLGLGMLLVAFHRWKKGG